jgi:hypothetical protein
MDRPNQISWLLETKPFIAPPISSWISSYAARVVRWALTPEGRHRKMAVTCQHFLLVGLVIALPGLAYAENAGPPPVPRFEPTPCPKLPGADELTQASCGYLVVPEKSQPAVR